MLSCFLDNINGERACRRHACLNRGGPSGARCAGKLVTLVQETWLYKEPFLASGTRRARGSSGWSFSGSNPCTRLGSSALLSWQFGFPPKAFLVADVLHPVSSSHLPAANSSACPRLALQYPRSSFQALCTPVYMCSSPGYVQFMAYRLSCGSHSNQTVTDQLLHPPSSLKCLPSVPANFPRCNNPFPAPAPPPWGSGSVLLALLLPIFFLPTQLCLDPYGPSQWKDPG